MMAKNRDSQEAPLLDSQVRSEVDKVHESGLLNYRSDALPTWCPGCGYYGITHALTGAISGLHIESRNLVYVSGIGCAGRYPFFVKGYGFHSVHGRALPVASGVKIANPKLTVVVLGGDGDGLGIGGGHLPHVARRNIDLTYILFDNGIYGLTKGQTSPTTPHGQVTSSHPYGNPDTPLDPITLALAYHPGFLARGWAAEPDELEVMMARAIAHKGFSLVVVTTPCVTFDKSNITYDRLRDQWEPLPEDHDPSDVLSAMQFAMSDKHYYGVFLEQSRPTFEDEERETALRAGTPK